jgi:hypothetical protein
MHAMLHKLMLEALCWQGGYLVKAQEAEGKFLVTFSSCCTALEWCVIVQDAAMRLPYPPALLNRSALRPVRDAKGRLVFRGPRLKMGVQEGVPTCIMPGGWCWSRCCQPGRLMRDDPCLGTSACCADMCFLAGVPADHLGRADVFGAVVNSAARLADAAAHGGQIAVELSLAQRILQQWRHQQHQQQPAPSLVPVSVAAHHLGSFLLKGLAKGVACVSFSAHDRRFPGEAPKGKGVRLSAKSGVLECVSVHFPGSVAGYALFSE